MWRPRDHERFIGGYDPEHEMPDPDREPRGRWQSDSYRHNARDARFPYRWDPDRFEERFRGRPRDDNELRSNRYDYDRGPRLSEDRGPRTEDYDRGDFYEGRWRNRRW